MLFLPSPLAGEGSGVRGQRGKPLGGSVSPVGCCTDPSPPTPLPQGERGEEPPRLAPMLRFLRRMIGKIVATPVRRQLRAFQDATHYPQLWQERILQQILRRQTDTDFGRDQLRVGGHFVGDRAGPDDLTRLLVQSGDGHLVAAGADDEVVAVHAIDEG